MKRKLEIKKFKSFQEKPIDITVNKGIKVSSIAHKILI
jgi:hypothetical protein